MPPALARARPMGENARDQSARGSVSLDDIADAADAAARDDEVALRALLQHGVPPDARCDFQMYLKHIFSDGQRAAASPLAKLPLLMIAIQSGATRTVALLLESRADPCVTLEGPTSWDGPRGTAESAFTSCFGFSRSIDTPIHLDAAHLIIEARVDPNKFGRSPEGCTELMIACEVGDLATARFLLDHKADVNLGKQNGSTPLFKAAQAGHLDVCRLLVHARANVDAPFVSGCTPLGAACGAGHEAIARLLLSVGANARVAAHDGLKPSDMAWINRHHGIVRLLAAPLFDAPQPLLLPGTRVTVRGLQAKPHLNGAFATILEFDRTSGRYATAFWHGGSVLGLKPVNVGVVVPDENAASRANYAAGLPVTASSPVRPQEVWSLLNGKRASGAAAHIALQWVCNLVRRREFDLAYAFPTPPEQQLAGKTMPLLAFSAGLMTRRNPSGPADDASNLVGAPELVRALLESKASVDARTQCGSSYASQGSNPSLADGRSICHFRHSHVQAPLWTGLCTWRA